MLTSSFAAAGVSGGLISATVFSGIVGLLTCMLADIVGTAVVVSTAVFVMSQSACTF